MIDDFNLTVPSDFDGTVRLLPVPSLVMLPGMIRGFHLDDPAQKRLVLDAVAENALLAFGMIQRSNVPGAFDHPQVHSTVCLTRILTQGENDDDSINLLVCGVCRAHIVGDVSSDHAYRVVRVTLIKDVNDLSDADQQKWRLDLLEQFRVMAGHSNVMDNELIRQLLVEDVPLGILVDILASAAEFPSPLAQSILETPGLAKRCEMVMAGLVESKTSSEDKPGFLPPFSDN